MSEAPDPGARPPRRTRTAEVADAISESAVRIGRLNPQQVLTIIAVGIMAFVCSLQAFQVWSERVERKEMSRERQERDAAQMREQNAQAELGRQHCSQESAQLRTFFADQNDKRMRFEADERSKDRAALASLVALVNELKRILDKGPD